MKLGPFRVQIKCGFYCLMYCEKRKQTCVCITQAAGLSVPGLITSASTPLFL